MIIYYRYYINKEIYVSDSFNILNYDNIVYLDLTRNKLCNLPKLPNNLINLDCQQNYLINLPILPNCLIKLHCVINKLNYLPKLSNNLKELCCYRNNLINLPILPKSLNYLDYLDWAYNKIIKLPKINKYYVRRNKNVIKFIDEYNLCSIQIKIYYYIEF